jgi:hypothetical protein
LCNNYPQGCNLSEEELEGCLANNAAKLLGLEPRPPPNTEVIGNWHLFVD